MHKDIELVPFEYLDKYFLEETKGIFRLELLSKYKVDYEQEEIECFRNGVKPGKEHEEDEWWDTLKSASDRGSPFIRCRLVEFPISEYLKYENSWGYKYSHKYGEQIYTIAKDAIDNFVDDVPIFMDFWLFGDNDCFLMLYDFDGQLICPAKYKGDITPYILLKNKLLEISTPYEKSDLYYL